MRQLVLCGYRLADGSDVVSDPVHKHGLPLWSAKTMRDENITSPSPFVQDRLSAEISGAGMTLGQATDHDGLAFDPFAFGTTFPPAWLRFESAMSGSSAYITNQVASGVTPPPESPFATAAVPTPSDVGAMYTGGLADGDFTFGNALMADDLEFFGSLSSMFSDAQDPGLPPMHPPQPFASDFFGYSQSPPSTATADPLRMGSLDQMDVPPMVLNRSSLEVQSEGSQDMQAPGSWQWASAPRSEL